MEKILKIINNSFNTKQNQKMLIFTYQNRYNKNNLNKYYDFRIESGKWRTKLNKQIINIFVLLSIFSFIPIVLSAEYKIEFNILGTGSSANVLSSSFSTTPNRMYVDDSEVTFVPSMEFSKSTHKVTLIWESPLSTCKNMFKDCKQIVNMNFDNFDTSTVLDMSYMFSDCLILTSLDLKYFKTSLVKDMNNMFKNCQELKHLNLENFDTSQVTNMNSMFYMCKVLASIDLSSFRVPLVKNMNNMFNGCQKLRFLDLSSFDPSSLTTMSSAFKSMSSLISIDLSNFNSPVLKSMANIFEDSTKIISLDLSHFNFSSLTNINNGFNKMNGKLKYCLNTTPSAIPSIKYAMVKQQLQKGYNVCDDDCFTKDPNKFIILSDKGTCIDECNITYQYEYDKECNRECPVGTHSSKENKYICIEDLECKHYYNYDMTECADELLEGYYVNNETLNTTDKCSEKCKTCNLESTKEYKCQSCNNEAGYYQMEDDLLNEYFECYSNISDRFILKNNIYYPCYDSCLHCSDVGDDLQHNCLVCEDGYWQLGTNCYKECQYFYYFDSENKYHCSENNQCPETYKLIKDKKQCINSCKNDGDYNFELNNECYKACPNGYHEDENNLCIIDLICDHYYNYTHTGCLDTVPDGFYCNNIEEKTIEKCDIKCKTCSLESVQKQLCTSCNTEENYFTKNNEINSEGFINCYNGEQEGFYLDNNIYKPCFETCKNCNGAGNLINHNCKECNDSSTLNDTNCYEICPFYYFFDDQHKYYCTEEGNCPVPYTKLIIEKYECVESCPDEFKFDFNNKCYKSCPDGTYYNYDYNGCIDTIPQGFYNNDEIKKTIEKCNIKCQNCDLQSTNNELCISCNKAQNYYLKENDNTNVGDYLNCYKDTPEAYFFDEENKMFKQCYKTCKSCTEFGNLVNHKCTSCYSNSTLNGTNCFEICTFHYYFDEENIYHCTEDENCPDDYNKFIVDKNECIDSCFGEFKYEFDNKCYKSCPPGTYFNYEHTGCIDTIPLGYYLNDSNAQTINQCNIKCKNCNLDSSKNDLCISCNNENNYYIKENDNSNKDSYINCYNQAPDGYYFDDENKRYSPCYKSCKSCTEMGTVENHKCTSCYSNSTLNDTNCYEICDYFYYFDSSKEYHCTQNEECPSDFPKKIREKKTCISDCTKDDYYNLEYNNICYNTCPEGTKIEDNPNLCEGYLICPILYNYDKTECLEEPPDGFYVNDSLAKTIDKCETKCKKCSKESNNNNLCIECNINNGYYPKEGDDQSFNGFIECFNTLSDGYFLDISNNIYKKCFETCKKCSNKGNRVNHKCEECYPNFSLIETNCYEQCNYYYYFDISNEYYCTEKEECPNGYKLISEKNKCIDDCHNDNEYIYEYNNKCYLSPIKPNCSDDSLYINKKTKECLNECNGIDFFLNICGLRYNSDNNKDIMIKNIENEIKNGLMNSFLLKLKNGEDTNNFLIKEKDISYQITTLENENNNNYQNISSISLGDCEDILKNIYKIDNSLSLIIFKVDYYKKDSLIPIIGYEIYNPINYSKLDLKYCEEKLAINSFHVEIDEDSLYKYDPNSEFYLDDCYPYTTENGTDIILEDRKIEYNKNDLSICENNCVLKEYLTENKMAECICKIKSEQIIVSKINNKSKLFSYNFTKGDYSISTFITMKCYYTLFSNVGIYKNIAFYLLLFILITTIISAIIFYKKGFTSLMNIVEDILLEKEKRTENDNVKEKDNNYDIKLNQKNIENLLKISTPKRRRISNLANKIAIPKEDVNSINNYSSNQRSISKIDLKNFNEIKYAKKKTLNLINKNQQSKSSNNYNDYELNTFSYQDALENDNRKYFKYYISLIKTKHPLIFPFFIKDYNSAIIKIDLILISFYVYYFINGIFINKSTIHKLYEDGGYYDIIYFIPYIIYSFLISHVITSLIKCICLSERNICKIKNENNAKKASEKMVEVKKLLATKYICFFSLSIVFEIFMGYNLSSFGAVYQNTQIVLFKNTLLSIAISFIYPFIINLLPGIFRINSLKSAGKKKLYIFSQIIQYL